MDESRSSSATRDLILDSIMRHRLMSAAELYRKLVATHEITQDSFAEELRSLATEGRVILFDPPHEELSFVRYLLQWQSELWFKGICLALTVALITIYAAPRTLPFVAGRWASGLIMVILLPGFATTKLLFKGNLSDTEQLALSVGLSLGLMPLIIIPLNYAPWGITLNSVAAEIAVISIFIGLAAVGRNYHQRKQPASRTD